MTEQLNLNKKYNPHLINELFEADTTEKVTDLETNLKLKLP